MDLSFQEKSAWGSLLAIAVSSWLFFPLAVPHIANGGTFGDIMGRLIFVIGVVIAIEIVYHSIIAAKSGAEGSDERGDERDAEFNLKADRLSGYILAIGVIWIAAHIIIRSSLPGAPPAPSSLLVSLYLMLALTAAEASKLATQIWFYRVNA